MARPDMTTHDRFQSQRRRSLRGFNLMEILVVLAIMGIIGMWGSKWLLTKLPHFRIQNANSQIQASFKVGAFGVHKRNQPVATHFDLTNKRIEVYYCTNADCNDADPDCDPINTVPEDLIRTLDFDTDSGLRRVNFARPDGSDAIQGFSDLGGGEKGAIYACGGELLETGSVGLVYDDHEDYFEVAASTQSGVVEVRKYLYSSEAPGGTAGYFPKANDPVTGGSIWVWYGNR